MNFYEILYQEVLKLKNQTEERRRSVVEEIASNQEDKRNSEVEIEDLERNKKEKNHIYSILVNYKEIIKDQIKLHIKVGGFISVVLESFFVVAGLITSLIIKDFIWKDILCCIPVSIVIGAAVALVNYISNTKHERSIHKEHNNQLYAFPVLINSLDKLIQLELESKSCYEAEIKRLMEIKDELNSDIDLFNQYLEFIDSKLPEVSYPCRHDVEAINEVYVNDPEIQNVAKLVRAKQDQK